jgi:hypothetical protein
MMLRTDRGGNRPVLYANYAEGGAIAASDWKPIYGALSYLKDEAAKYIKARKALGSNYYGATLHIIWIGLNDLITAQRAAGINMYAKDEIFEVGLFDRNKKGTGIELIVQEIKDVIDSIGNAFPVTRDTDHYVLIDLPSPTVSIRFRDKIADGKVQLLNKFEKNTQHFNDLLASVVTNWPAATDGTLGADQANISLVRMSDWMNRVSANAEAFDLIPTAQLPGVKVLYGGQKDDPVMPLRRALTTSDLAHPTQAVYELIARKIADHLVDRYTVGWFDAETWRTNRPFPNVNP